ncbi:MAG: ATP-binding protein [Bacteroidota bacterium]
MDDIHRVPGKSTAGAWPALGMWRLRQRVAGLEIINQALLQAKHEAEAADRAKSEFLAMMSHELRTPINALLGMLDLALKTGLTAEQGEYLGAMKVAGVSLLSVVNNILDLARVEAGQFEVENIPFSLRHCVGETLKMLAFEARQKGLRLDCEISASTPDALSGDPQRLRQILINLVGNAIKFTERGSIVVRAELHAGNPNEVSCHFSVRDTGIGIAPDKQADIFQPYRQADAATSRLYGGSGLGLSISARLVAMMNGKIWVDSVPGQGSTFHFTACFGRQTAVDFPGPAPSVADARAPKQQLTVLLAEDNPTNRRLAQITLEKAGHRVLLADCGTAVRSLLLARRPDVILMDVEMPGMNGLQTTAHIRAAERRDGGHLPIIALTAHALPDDRKRCLQVGMDAYLAKPVDPETLLATLQRLAGSPPATTPRPVVLDRPALLRRVGGDRQLLGEICDIFRRDCAQLMLAARQALATHDAAAFADNMHTLHGMFRSLAANAAQETAGQLEELAVDDPRVALAFEGLEHQVEALGRALQGLAGAGNSSPIALTGKARAAARRSTGKEAQQ